MKQAPSNRKGAWLRICEIYGSVQGEGLLTGTPSVFVRTSGCNLRCWFCDTPFASWQPEGQHWPVDHICDRVAEAAQELSAAHHLGPTGGQLSSGQPAVVLTGGEPLIYAAIDQLCDQLQRRGHHLTIETAGTIYRPLACDLISISPKLSSSAPPPDAGSWHTAHQARRERLDVVRQLISDHPYQLKFVIDTPADTDEVLQYLQRLGGDIDLGRVLLMPQGIRPDELEKRGQWLEPWCATHGMRFCPRAHIQWFGNRRGT